MALTTPAELLVAVEKSKLLGAVQMAQAREIAAAEGESASAETVVRAMVHKELLTRWQAARLLAGSTVFFLGKYKLIDQLGRGGMGTVLLAEHVMMNRRVALKILPKGIDRATGSLERFLAEARLAASLDHPNIVHAYNVDYEGERYFLAMEYVDGVDLQRMVEYQGPLDFDQAADYIRQAADGLAHAHQQKIIHCDIKPGNLLVNQQGVVKILDLGLARIAGDEDQGHEESVLGTVDYLAPEQALGTAQFDHRADIYSLGCTLYFLLTGHPPFPEGSLHERILKHQTQQPRSIGSQRAGAPAELVAICEKMMAKEPQHRYATTSEVALALARYQIAHMAQRRLEPPVLRKPPPDDIWADFKVAPNIEEALAAASSQASVAAEVLAAAPLPSPSDAFLGSGVRRLARRKEPKPTSSSSPLHFLMVAGACVAAVIVILFGWKALMRGLATQSHTPTKIAAEESADIEPENTTETPEPEENTPVPVEQSPSTTTGPEPPPTVFKTPPKYTKNPNQKKKRPNKNKKLSAPSLDRPTNEPSALRDLSSHANVPDFTSLTPSDGAADDSPLGEAVSFGTLSAEAAFRLRLNLVRLPGARGMSQIGLDRDEQHPGSWLLFLQDKVDIDPEADFIPVARISVADRKLQFQWLAVVKKLPTLSLRNWALRASIGTNDFRYVAFSAPRIVQPLTIDLERGMVRQTLPLDSGADLSSIRIEIVRLEGVKRPVQIAPDVIGPWLTGDQASAASLITLNVKTIPVQFAVLFNASIRPPTLQLQCGFTPPNGGIPEFLGARVLKSRLAEAQKVQRLAEAQAQNKKLPKEAIAAAQAQLKVAKQDVNRFNALLEFCDSLNKVGKIHYRVLTIVEGQSIELANSEPSQAASDETAKAGALTAAPPATSP